MDLCILASLALFFSESTLKLLLIPHDLIGPLFAHQRAKTSYSFALLGGWLLIRISGIVPARRAFPRLAKYPSLFRDQRRARGSSGTFVSLGWDNAAMACMPKVY